MSLPAPPSYPGNLKPVCGYPRRVSPLEGSPPSGRSSRAHSNRRAPCASALTNRPDARNVGKRRGSIRRSDNSAGNRIRVRPVELLACSRQGRCPRRQQEPRSGRRSPSREAPPASFVPGSPLGRRAVLHPPFCPLLRSAPSAAVFSGRGDGRPRTPARAPIPTLVSSRRIVTPDPSATLVTGVGPRSTRWRRRSR